MSSDTVEIVLAAQDRASAPIQKVEGGLLGLTKSARLMHRETYGVSKFANALDTVAGTNFGNTISSLTILGEVAQPLKDLGSKLVAGFTAPLAAAGGKLADGVAAMWMKVGLPGSASMVAAQAAGTGMGGAFVSAVGGALAPVALTAIFAAPIAIVADMFLNNEQGEQAVTDWLARTFKPFQTYTDQIATFAKPLGDAVDKVMQTIFGSGPSASQKHNFVHDSFTQPFQQAAKDSLATVAGVYGHDSFAVITPAMKAVADASSRSYGDEFAHDSRTVLVPGSIAAAKAVADAFATKQIWDASARAVGGDLAKALEGVTGPKGVIATAMDKVRFALKHPYALMKDQAKIQGAITHIQYLESLSGVTPGQKTIFDQQIAWLETQWSNISGKAYTAGGDAQTSYNQGVQNAPPPHIQTPTAPGFNPGQINRYNPPHRAAGGPANAGQTYVVNERGIEYLHMGSQSGYISPSGGVPPHSHDIYISGKKVMEATSAHLGQRLAMSSTAPYTRG